MLDIKEFDPEDANLVCPHAMEESAKKDYYNKMLNNNKAGPTFTIWNGDTALAIAGIRVEDKIGCAWIVMSSDASKCPFSITKAIRKGLKAASDYYNLTMLYALSVKTMAKSQRLLEHLGFSHEAENDTHYLYTMFLKEVA